MVDAFRLRHLAGQEHSNEALRRYLRSRPRLSSRPPRVKLSRECSSFVVHSRVNTGAYKMAKTEMIRARVEPDLKVQAERVLRELGLSATDAITLFYKQVVLRQGVPFDLSVPNSETVDALRQTREPDELTEYPSIDELKAALQPR